MKQIKQIFLEGESPTLRLQIPGKGFMDKLWMFKMENKCHKLLFSSHEGSDFKSNNQ